MPFISFAKGHFGKREVPEIWEADAAPTPKREERLSNSAKPEFRATFPPGDGESGITSASGHSGITCAAGRSGTTHAAVRSIFAQPNPKCAQHRSPQRPPLGRRGP
ncbi:unnamed protein product [Gadus morhua 'NCC']